jgi:hypothetical protein
MGTRAPLRKILAVRCDLLRSLLVIGATRVPPLLLRCPRHKGPPLRVDPLRILSKLRFHAGRDSRGRHESDLVVSVEKRNLAEGFSSYKASGVGAGLTFRQPQ